MFWETAVGRGAAKKMREKMREKCREYALADVRQRRVIL